MIMIFKNYLFIVIVKPNFIKNIILCNYFHYYFDAYLKEIIDYIIYLMIKY